MDANEIVRALRLANDYPHDAEIFNRAADCIESLQAQLAELQVKHDGHMHNMP